MQKVLPWTYVVKGMYGYMCAFDIAGETLQTPRVSHLDQIFGPPLSMDI
jgi:hypothetical protein